MGCGREKENLGEDAATREKKITGLSPLYNGCDFLLRFPARILKKLAELVS